MDARTLYFTGPGSVAVRTETVSDPVDDEVVVETQASGISAGSELLVYRGEFPESLPVDATIDALDGEFDYPLAYGYASVGTVTATGPDSTEWLDRRVFAFEPHATRFRTTPDAVVELPDDVATQAATLLPTVETATNLVLDAQPRIGERAVVFGAGAVGLATTQLLASFPLSEVVVVEPLASRRATAAAVGADRTIDPGSTAIADAPPFADAEPAGADVVFELSGRPETLDDAIAAAGYDSRVIVGSWYGAKRAPVDLGGSFHRDRVDIVSSQVSTLSPELRGRWDTDRRFDVAFDRLDAMDADALITHELPLDRAADAYALLDDHPDEARHIILTYQ